MTYAPKPLQDWRTYMQQQTGLPAVSLGHVGSAGHHAAGTSYHIGWSSLHSWAYSRQHRRDTKLKTDATSASDTGNFRRLVELTMWAVAEARAGRRPDTREIIGPWSDGRAYRFDALNGWKAELRVRGDSHETHMHESWFRDSEHRDKIQFYRPFFEGAGGGETSVPVPSGSPLLRQGSSGSDVRQLQRALNEVIYAGLTADGQFGPATEKAVKAFQRSVGLKADGIYGPNTAAKLREELSMPTAEEIANAVHERMKAEVTASQWAARQGLHPPGRVITLQAGARNSWAYGKACYQLLKAQADPAELAEKLAPVLVAALAGQVGAPSTEQLTEALRTVLREGVEDDDDPDD